MNNRMELIFEAIAMKGNIGYASDYNRNSLFEVNMETGECLFLRMFDEESVYKKRLHCSAVWIENRVFFIPGSGDRISIFYPEDSSLKSLKFPLPQNEQYSFYKKNYKFISAIQYGNYLWLIPSTYPGVLRLDIQTDEIKIFDGWISNTEYMFRNGICIEKNKFLIPSGNNNVVLVFDMEKESGRIMRIGTHNNGVMSMCKDKGNYWLAPRRPGPIISWNPLSGNVMEYMNYPDGFEAGEIVFAKVYVYDESVIFLPAKANCGLVFANGKLAMEKNIQWKTGAASIFEYLFETEKEYYCREALSDNSNRYIRISKADNSLSTYVFFYEDNGVRDKKMMETAIANREIVKESTGIKIWEFIRGIT